MNYCMLFLVLISMSGLASAGEAPEKVRQLSNFFNTLIMECPGRLWANYNWDNTKVILVDPKDDEIWVWDANSKSIESQPVENFPSSVLQSNYDFLEHDGMKAMSLLLEEDESVDNIMDTAVHEFFHHLTQEKWSESASSRGTAYPYDAKPRYLRRMLYDRLKDYFKTKDVQALQKAKYWYELWKNNYPDEFHASTDGYEGSAQYVGTVTSALMKTGGCSASEADLREAVLEHVENKYGKSLSSEYFMLDGEGYDIGGLASLILRFDLPTSAWQHEMEKGRSPLDILFSESTTCPDEDQDVLRALFGSSAEVKNQEVEDLIGKDLRNIDSKEFVRVSVSIEWLKSNFMPINMIKLKDELVAYPLRVDHPFESEDKKNVFILKPSKVIFFDGKKVGPQGPCSSPFFTLVHQSEISKKGGALEIKSSHLSGSFSGELQTTENQFTSMCLY